MVGVLDILGAVLFFSSEWTVAVLVCTIKNMRCEVMTIQNYCYALVSCQIFFFLLTDHAVGTGVTAFGMFGVTCIGRDLLPSFFFFFFLFSFALALQESDALLPMPTLQQTQAHSTVLCLGQRIISFMLLVL